MSLLVTLAVILFGIGLVGVASDYAGSSRGRMIALLGPVAITLGGLAWHKLILHLFSGDTFLVYGFFETVVGRTARPWAITVPWLGVLVALFIFCVAVSRTFGFRGLEAAGLTSWAWSVIVFTLFSAYMFVAVLQGDAAIFI